MAQENPRWGAGRMVAVLAAQVALNCGEHRRLVVDGEHDWLLCDHGLPLFRDRRTAARGPPYHGRKQSSRVLILRVE